jgi:hypothetical protein
MTVVTSLRMAPTELAVTEGDQEIDVQVGVDMECLVDHDGFQEVRHYVSSTLIAS